MKKLFTLLLALVMALSIVGCGQTNTEPDTPDTPDDDGDAAVTVMTHAEFDAAAVDSPVTVETYIQARQGWWEKDGVGVATFYTQADDGAYFLYNMPCSKEDYDSMLVEGAKIRVSGYKAEWSGEVEIIDAPPDGGGAPAVRSRGIHRPGEAHRPQPGAEGADAGGGMLAGVSAGAGYRPGGGGDAA